MTSLPDKRMLVIIYSNTPQTGTISWLENPTSTTTSTLWNAHTIATGLAQCLVRAGKFSQGDTLQVVAVPVTSDVPLGFNIFTKPADPTQNWIPEPPVTVAATPCDALVIPSSSTGGSVSFDQIVLASGAGIDVHWYDQGAWQTFHVGAAPGPGPIVASVSVGRVGNDYAGYIGSYEVCIPLAGGG